MNLRLLLPLGVLISASVQAQANPTVLQDSLYKLAVNPAEHPDEAYVWLLDEGVYRIEPDGRTVHTVRQVVQILKPEGAEAYRERRLSWNPEHQKLTLNWMRVVKSNGEVVSGHPEQIQDSDVPAAMGTPMYTATKVRRLSLSGLEPGTILDFSVTTESDKPMMTGEFYLPWRVTTPTYVVRSNLELNMPDGFNPRIVEKNLTFKRVERVEKGRRVINWRLSAIPRFRAEAYAPDSIPQGMTITISPPITWASIGEWYAPIARQAYAITPPVEEKMSRVLKGARSLGDSIAKLHKWVAQDIRYVAIELGRGGYVPRDAETVVRTGFGDCKDKAMLFLAALRKIGVTGYPVLLNINGSENKGTPSLGQFNHMIAAVKRGNAYQFADMTAGAYPLGRLPRSEQGNLAVLVKETDAEQIILPEAAASESGVETRIAGALAEDGNFSGTYEEAQTGDMDAGMRQIFQMQLDSARRQLLGRTIAGRNFDRPEIDSVEGFDGKDFNARAKVTTKIVRAKILTRVGDVSLLTNPIRPMEYQMRLAETLEREKDRKLPYEMSKLVSPYTTHIDVRIKLPPGWTATLPANLLIDGPVGRFEMTYSQSGTELNIERKLTGSRQVIPASRQKELVDQLKRMGSDDARLIVIKAPPHSLASHHSSAMKGYR